MGYHQLRFLDRNRTRRNIDLGHPFPYPPEVAHLHQPLGRSDDHLCRDLRGYLSRVPRRSRLDGLVSCPDSQCQRDLAKLSQPPSLGRFCGVHLLHGLPNILVPRPDSRPGIVARSGHDSLAADGLWASCAGLAGIESSLDPLREDLSHPRRNLDPTSSFRPQRRFFRFRHLHCARVAHHHLPSLLCRRRDLRWLCHGAHSSDSVS